MTNGWQTVRLGDVLKRVKSELTIDDSVTYKQVTVRLWNKGVVLRGEQEGVAIKTKRQFYVTTGQLLMSRIDVRNGAIGLVPKELDGAIVDLRRDARIPALVDLPELFAEVDLVHCRGSDPLTARVVPAGRPRTSPTRRAECSTSASPIPSSASPA